MVSSITSLEIYKFAKNPIQILMKDGEPWFVARDICDALGLGNPRTSVALLDNDEKGVHNIDTLGGPQDMTIINESGMYSLILRSRKPEAKRFKRWITWEVLPSIRKTGGYGNAIPKTYSDALRVAADSAERAEKAEAKIRIDAPKVAFADLLADSEDLITATAIAKCHGMSAKAFNKLLNGMGVLFRQGGTWYPYAKYEDKVNVYFRYVLTPYHDTKGTLCQTRLLKWTERGAQWIMEMISDRNQKAIEDHDAVA